MSKVFKWLISGAILSRLSFGYLDPGSGSFILQLLVSGLLGFMLTFKLFWHRIAHLFRRSGRDQVQADEESSQITKE